MKKVISFLIVMILMVFTVVEVDAKNKNRIIKKGPGYRILCENRTIISCPNTLMQDKTCKGITASNLDDLADQLCNNTIAVKEKKETKEVSKTTQDNSNDSEPVKHVKESIELVFKDFEEQKEERTHSFYLMPAAITQSLFEKMLETATQDVYMSEIFAIRSYASSIFCKLYYTDQITCPSADPRFRNKMRDLRQYSNIHYNKLSRVLRIISEKNEPGAEEYAKLARTALEMVPDLVKEKYKNSDFACGR